MATYLFDFDGTLVDSMDTYVGVMLSILDKNGIKYDALKSMNMQVTDLLQAMRAAGYFSIDEIAYAIFETNGQLSVIANQNAQKSQHFRQKRCERPEFEC